MLLISIVTHRLKKIFKSKISYFKLDIRLVDLFFTIILFLCFMHYICNFSINLVFFKSIYYDYIYSFFIWYFSYLLINYLAFSLLTVNFLVKSNLDCIIYSIICLIWWYLVYLRNEPLNLLYEKHLVSRIVMVYWVIPAQRLDIFIPDYWIFIKGNKNSINKLNSSETERYNSLRCKEDTPQEYWTDLAIRNFLKGYLSNFFKDVVEFKTYDDIIDFIKRFKPNYKISKQSLSNLRHRPIRFKILAMTDESIAFVKYIKKHFPYFDEKFLFDITNSYNKSPGEISKDITILPIWWANSNNKNEHT